MKIMILKEASEEVHKKIVQDSDKALKIHKKTFESLIKTISGLEPHSKLYFVNELIFKILNSTELPPFAITALLDGLKHLFQYQPVAIMKEKLSKDSGKYIG